MNSIARRAPLFTAAPGDARAIVLTIEDTALLQDFFTANPAYFLAVNGQPPRANEAHEEFHDLPPAEMKYSKRLHIGFVNDKGELLGMAGVLADFLVPRVWHIGLFVVATQLHGSGAAHNMYDAMERWIKREGAQWVRLGVVSGNLRAERFWSRLGYAEVRKREGIAMGVLVNTVRVMVKPLEDQGIADYLALVARDRPG